MATYPTVDDLMYNAAAAGDPGAQASVRRRREEAQDAVAAEVRGQLAPVLATCNRLAEGLGAVAGILRIPGFEVPAPPALPADSDTPPGPIPTPDGTDSDSPVRVVIPKPIKIEVPGYEDEGGGPVEVDEEEDNEGDEIALDPDPAADEDDDE